MEEKVINIGGRLHDTSKHHTVTGANEILDDDLQKKQNVINAEQQEFNQEQEGINADTYRKNEVYNKEQVNNLISRTPQTDIFVVNVPEGTDIATYLKANVPAEDRPNNLFRVPGPSNSSFSEWAWDGTDFIPLDEKDYGIDNFPTPGSNNLVKSGGCVGPQKLLGTAETLNLSFTAGSYVNKWGLIVNHSSGRKTAPILLQAGEAIVFTSNANNYIATLAVTDINESFYTPVSVGDIDDQHIAWCVSKYIADEPVYVVLSSFGEDGVAQKVDDDGIVGNITVINKKLSEGYVYAGIATPNTNPGTPTGKVFYIAINAGTYTNFGSLSVNQGINTLNWNGSVWSLDQIFGVDDEPTPDSNNLVKSGGCVGPQKLLGTTESIIVSYTSGSYVNKWGLLVEHQSGRKTGPILLQEGDAILVNSTANNYIATIAITDENESFYEVATVGDGGEEQVSRCISKYIAKKQVYVVLSSYGEDGSAKKVKDDGIIGDVCAINTRLGDYISYTLRPSCTSGSFVNMWGIVTSFSAAFLSEPVLVRQGDRVVVNGYGNEYVSMISKTNQEASLYSVLVCGTGDSQGSYLQEVEYTADEEMYIAFSYLTEATITLYRYTGVVKDVFENKNKIKEIQEEIGEEEKTVPSLTWNNGKYINKWSQVKDNLTSGRLSNPVPVKKGDKITYTGSANGYISMISITDENGAWYDVGTLGVGDESSVIVQTAEYIATKDCYVAFSSLSEGSSEIYHTDGIIEEINDLQGSVDILNDSAPSINLLTAFDNLVCIGDSLTWSAVYTSSTNWRQARVPYPKALARICGSQEHIFAWPGATAWECWGYYGDSIIAETNALAIIYLGTNYGITDTIETDIVGDNPDNWAENSLGGLCRFVQKCQSLGMKVLLIRPWITSGTGTSDLTATNNAIRHVAEKFGCAYLDAPVITNEGEGTVYHFYPNRTGSNSVHYNDLGYQWFASRLIYEVSKLEKPQLMQYLIPE